MAANQENLETAVERLVRELGQVCQSADPGTGRTTSSLRRY